jgi:heme-degrading monooxygenase HmoA
MAYVLGVFDTGDYDKWKQMFDSDPAGRSKLGKGHRVFRSVADPNKVFVSVEFASADDAKSFREALLASGALDNVTVATEPTVAELVDETKY